MLVFKGSVLNKIGENSATRVQDVYYRADIRSVLSKGCSRVGYMTQEVGLWTNQQPNIVTYGLDLTSFFLPAFSISFP